MINNILKNQGLAFDTRFFASNLVTKIRSIAINVALVIAGTLYVTLLSQIVVPLPNTPIMLSMGTFSVVTVGAILGANRGASSVALFALLGFVGLPVFQGWKAGFGLASCGYVFGYIIAAFIMGKVVDKMSKHTGMKSVAKLFSSHIVALIPVYVLGVAFLMVFLDTNNITIGLEKGFYPFLIGEIIKIAISTGFIPTLSIGMKKLDAKLKH